MSDDAAANRRLARIPAPAALPENGCVPGQGDTFFLDMPSSAGWIGDNVQVPRLADVVADRIRDDIISGDLADGDRLPPLEALVEQFGVSLPSMREALRILEAEGLIDVKRGSVGGAVVHRPNATMAAYNLALVLGARGVAAGDVATALTELEPLCAMFCARRPDRSTEVVRDLRRINAGTEKLVTSDELTFNEHTSTFHAAIVRQCGNATLTLVVGALQAIWLTDVRAWARAATRNATYPDWAERSQILKLHEHITELIDRGEDAEVHRVMREHIDMGRVYEEVDASRRVDPRAVRSGARSRRRDPRSA